jgi:glycosyltransferase involved in cell wall biosynthesis
VEILAGEIITNEVNKNANGGSELMTRRIAESLDKDLLKEFQIISSRVRNLDESKLRVLICHDLPGDPESEHLANDGWNRFHRIVFVSNWQMQGYISRYNIPWSKCIVMQNAIEPIDFDMANKARDKIRLAYHTTPHRGLQILVPVFQKLAEEFNDITLDVYSSFKIYGWDQRDEQYASLFDACKEHAQINYHGFIPNDKLRVELKNKHIYAYPSIWLETSCISLMEAMSAGMVCVHPNYGALFETSANWTHMYQWSDNMNEHANIFYTVLRSAIIDLKEVDVIAYKNKIMTQKSYVDVFYNWEMRKNQWSALLSGMLGEPREFPKKMYVYKVQ